MVSQSLGDENTDMEQLLDEVEANYRTLQRGEVVDGVIMKVDRDGLLVNLGQKTEGVVPSREMRALPDVEFDALHVGDGILVAVDRLETEEGQALLSLDRAKGEQAWRKLQTLADQAVVIEAPVTGYNKGGAIVTVEGIQGFVPLSQLSSVPRQPPGSEDTGALAALTGKTLKMKVIEVNRRRNRAIFSERAAVQVTRQAMKAKILEELAEGQVRLGQVSGVTNFGVFVDLGGADGLIHISELSWESVRSPEDVVKIGDDINVYVMKVDLETKRIALSLKRTQPEPWANLDAKFVVGQVVPATITKLATFGAFARLDGSIEGLIHISELADKVIGHPKEVVKEGDQLTVKIVKLELDRRRIGLSLKQATEPQQPEASSASFGEPSPEKKPASQRPAAPQKEAARQKEANSYTPEQAILTSQMAAELSKAFAKVQHANQGEDLDNRASRE